MVTENIKNIRCLLQTLDIVINLHTLFCVHIVQLFELPVLTDIF